MEVVAVIQQGEISQIAKWVLIWVGSWFVAFNLQSMIAKQVPEPAHQIIFGVLILFVVIWFWDIRKF